MMNPRIPVLSADEVDTNWLTQAIRSQGIDAKVVDFEASAVGNGQLAVTKRFVVKYDQENPALPNSFIGKFTSEDPVAAETGSTLGIYRSEVMFYRELGHRTEIRTPKAFAAEIDDNGRFSLLLEDLSPARPGNQLTKCTLEETKSALIEAAKLNAAFWDDTTLLDRDWIYIPDGAQGFYTTEMIEQAWAHVKKNYDGALPKDVVDVCERFVSAHELWNRPRSGPKCLMHNDFRQDNMMFSPDGTIAVVDWQTVSFLAAGMDPSYFLSGALDRDVRSKHENELRLIYFDTLIEHGVAGYSFDDFVLDYRHYTFAALAVAMVATVLTERSERGDRMLMGMICDGAHHVLDNHALDLLEDSRAIS